MGVRSFIQQIFYTPQPIYSRHKAEVFIGDVLYENENFVFGLDERNSVFKLYRSYWFITELKLIFIDGSFPAERVRNIYLFEDIEDMRVFDEEGRLVIETASGVHEYDIETESERSFAYQAIEQFERVKQAVESAEAENDEVSAEDDEDEVDTDSEYTDSDTEAEETE